MLCTNRRKRKTCPTQGERKKRGRKEEDKTMALQLILGGSGSGKTTALYETVIQESIQNPDESYFVIVPEQFTMQAQKDMVMMHPAHGTMNIDVLSFQRLAYRVFEELAVENLQVLDDMGKSMVLRKVTAACRKQLVLFGGHLNQAGFVGQLKSMISEFYQYGLTPELLRETAPEAKSPFLRQKLEEFAIVFENFQEYIEGHYITAEQVLDVLCRMIPKSRIIKNSQIALDGYTGFTPVQYRLIELLFVYAKKVTVTVTADPDEAIYRNMGMQSLFYMSHQMVVRLSELAEKNQVRKLPDRLLKREPAPRFEKSPDIGWLERHLFRYRGGVFPGKPNGSVELYQASGVSEEISRVVHQICRAVKQEGLRYRDFAVVTGDLDGYGREIQHQFELNEIPCFLDDRKNVLDNSLVELIRSALEVVRRDFSYESVFRFLRTGLVVRERELIDRMENYVLALGIRGSRKFRETWERTYRGAKELNLVELNAFKEKALAPLFHLQEAFRREDLNVAGMVQGVCDLLTECRAEEKMEAYAQYFHEIGEFRLEKEYSQVYGLVGELLNRLLQLLGEEKVSRQEFQEILDAGFAEISVGVIPATVDRVVVGDIVRTRLSHVKVLFFVGVNDGIVPMHRDGGSLLSDREREFFGQCHLELAPTAREDSFRQRFYLYLLLTKPSERLVVSYSCVGTDGKSRRPSYLIGELKNMFPGLYAIREEQENREEKSRIYSLEEARKQMIAGLEDFCDDVELWGNQRKKQQEKQQEEQPQEQSKEQQVLGEAPKKLRAWKKHAEFLELYRWFLNSGEHRDEAEKLADAACYRYEKQGIGHAVAQALYGTILSGSVTRLEQYAACAYGHFLKYGLELEERPRFELAPADLGTLFHNSIDLCFQRVKDQGLDWQTITEDQRTALVHSCVESVASEYGNQILESSSRNAYLGKRLEQITQRTVWALQKQIQKGDFVPAGFEVSFSAADNLEAMKIALSPEEALHLRGRIDRMDLCEDGDQVYVKIIDYKSGSTSFDLMALYYGLQLQLVVYMDAVMEITKRHYPEKEVVPAGILYYNISDPIVQKEEMQNPEIVDAQILRQLRMNGLINSELEAIHHLDRTVEKESDIIPVVLKNGEVLESKSSVANRDRFESLRTYVHEKVRKIGQEILDGTISVEPYKNGQRSACDYCPYHSVCGFDKKSSGYEFKKWKKMKSEEIWEEICQTDQREQKDQNN